MSKPQIPASELTELFRRVIRGEVNIALEDPVRTWTEAYAGDVAFLVAGWKIAFFNDCMDLDYTDSAVAPDGRRSEFDDWFDHDGACPLDFLDGDEHAVLERIVEAAQ